MKVKVVAALAALALSVVCAEAKTFAERFPGRTFDNQKAQQFVESLSYQDGTVQLGAGGVQLNVPDNFYFLSGQDARRLLTEAWGNPPSAADGVLGMIMPADKTPLDKTWGAVITFNEDGYVSDDDAAGIDYTALLKDMQEGTARANEERTKQGFPAIRLVGWASPPYYDRVEHKLHWAKELEFADTPKDHTLNYSVRALGRKGVLEMNFVAGMEDLEEIKNVIPAVMGMPEFKSGWRYADYVPGADKVAAYGIGGLIAGKLLAKVGILALVLAFLKKGFVLVLVAVGGLWRFVVRLFRGKREEA
jgi:uncharacterized membrane-anchored protein